MALQQLLDPSIAFGELQSFHREDVSLAPSGAARLRPPAFVHSSAPVLAGRYAYGRRVVAAAPAAPPSQRAFSAKNPVRRTTLFPARRLGRHMGVHLTLACETLQDTGSFDIRAAYNIVAAASHSLFITHSSGNFGAALACAATRRGKRSIVVLPTTTPQCKIEAIREHQGQVELVDIRRESPADRVRELATEYPQAYVIKPDEDPFGIKGIATLGKELGLLKWGFDAIVAPIDGGTLAAGVILGLREAHSRILVVGAEPLLANDAARSLKAGEIVANSAEPETIADEARALSLGQATWPILFRSLGGIVEVPEAKIAEAVRLLFELANVKAEPSGALALAALLSEPLQFRGRAICVIVSAANIDSSCFAELLGA